MVYIDIFEFYIAFGEKKSIFIERLVKFCDRYDTICTVTVCGKQEKYELFKIKPEGIVIECGIYQKLKLSQIAKKIGKTPGSVSRENPTEQDVCFGRASGAEKTAVLQENVKQKVCVG